jgi:hypothetical protein
MALKKQKIQKWPHGFLPKKIQKRPQIMPQWKFCQISGFFLFFLGIFLYYSGDF